MRFAFSKYIELGHFTLLFCRGRQRNVQRFKRHVHSYCFSHKPFVSWSSRCRRLRGLLKLPIQSWRRPPCCSKLGCQLHIHVYRLLGEANSFTVCANGRQKSRGEISNEIWRLQSPFWTIRTEPSSENAGGNLQNLCDAKLRQVAKSIW